MEKRPGVSGDAAEKVRARVVHVSGDEPAIAVFGGGDAAAQRRPGKVTGVDHAERAKDILGREGGDVFSADARDHVLQDQEADVGIDESRSRRRDERRIGQGGAGRRCDRACNLRRWFRRGSPRRASAAGAR